MAVIKPLVRKSPNNNNNSSNDSFQTFILHNDILTTAHDVFVDSTQSTSTSVPIYELGKQLLSASKNGNISEIKSLMGRGAAFTPDWLGACPLHYAAGNGHVGACEVLLRAGISRNSRTKVDRTPLHMAVYEGHIDVTDCLMKHGADVNARDMLAMTPLQWAVQRSNIPYNNGNSNTAVTLVKSLLKYGANVRWQNKFGNTALDIAQQLGHTDLIRLIQNALIDQMDPIDQPEVNDGGITELLHCNNSVNSVDSVIADQHIDQHQVNEYLNDVRLSTVDQHHAHINPQLQQQQQQVVTIEDCIETEDVDDVDEDNDISLVKTIPYSGHIEVGDGDANNSKVVVGGTMLYVGDAGYCSSSSDQQQSTTNQLHIDLTKDESTGGVDVDGNETVEQDDLHISAQEQQSADNIDPYRLLRQRYGIELLPEVEEDGGRILKQAMDSGHTVSLTEAGKRALSEFKPVQTEVDRDPQQPQQHFIHKELLLHRNQQIVIVDNQHQQQPAPITQHKPLQLQLQLQLVNNKVMPSMSNKGVQIRPDTGTVKLANNTTTNTSKQRQKRLMSSSSFAPPLSQMSQQLVLLPHTVTKRADEPPITVTVAPSSVDGTALNTGAATILVRQHKHIRHKVQQQQQETTLLTLTADEFAGLQANGGLVTTSNGIYRIMDYNHTPAAIKHKRARTVDTVGGSTCVIVQDLHHSQQPQPQPQPQSQPLQQRRQLVESETVKALRQQLQEQRHLVDVYKRKYLKKEAEVERFKQQLKLMLKHRSSNKNLNSVIYINSDSSSR